MTARSGRSSGLEFLSIILAILSLAVSIGAAVIGIAAWRRPFPPDPTVIPTFGQSGNPERIDAGEGGRRFFAFLDKHPDRKIRVNAIIDDDRVRVNSDGLLGTYFWIPRTCPEGQDCFTDKDALDIRGGSKDRPGLIYSSGVWILRGYFANSGLVVEKQSTAERAVTVIDIVTAVS